MEIDLDQLEGEAELELIEQGLREMEERELFEAEQKYIEERGYLYEMEGDN